jgi:hypothetical protein
MDPSTDPGPPPAEARPLKPESAIVRPLISLVAIAVFVWLVFYVSGYGKRYAQMAKPWAKGQTQLVEITLTKEDKENLFCASDVVLDAGVRCAFTANQQKPTPPVDDDRLTLRPYVTVNHDLLLGSGLWSAPDLGSNLPSQRFTVACNFTITGVIKSVSLRWSPTGSFDPVKQSVPAGTLSDCAFPR